MFAEAFGVLLLILLIVITWRVVDSIMQAPGTSPALPYVSVPPSVVSAGVPLNTTAAAVPGATSTPSALPPVVLPPASTATDLQSSMGLSGLSMPTFDMSAYYPTSLAGTPAPTVPAATPVVTPPVVSAPAPLVVAPPVVAPVTPAPTPVVTPATQADVPAIPTYSSSDTMVGSWLPTTPAQTTTVSGIPPNVCQPGMTLDRTACKGTTSAGIPFAYAATCPSGYTSAWDNVTQSRLCYPPCPSGYSPSAYISGTCTSCPSGTTFNGVACGSQSCPSGLTRVTNSMTGRTQCVPPNSVQPTIGPKVGSTCPSGSALYNGFCLSGCPAGTTKMSKDFYCMA